MPRLSPDEPGQVQVHVGLSLATEEKGRVEGDDVEKVIRKHEWPEASV